MTVKTALEAAIDANDEAAALALTNAVASLEAAIASGKSDAAAELAQTVTSLTNLINAANGRITDVEDKLTDSNSKNEEHEEKIRSLESQLAEAKAKNEENESRLNDTQDQLKTSNDKIKGVQNSLVIASIVVGLIALVSLAGVAFLFFKKR